MTPDLIIYASLIALRPVQAAVQTKISPPKVQTLEVRVLDPEGQPVNEATVRLFTQPFKVLLTNPEGIARFQDLKPGSYRMNAGKNGFRVAEQVVVVKEDQPATLEIRLSRHI